MGKKLGFQGFSLVSVVISLGIVSAIGVMNMRQVKTSMSASKTVENRYEESQTLSQIRAFLSRDDNCRQSFQGYSPIENLQKIKWLADKRYHRKKSAEAERIINYELSKSFRNIPNTTNETDLLITFERSPGSLTGKKQLTKPIRLQVELSGGLITNCWVGNEVFSSLWTYTNNPTIDDIYYPGKIRSESFYVGSGPKDYGQAPPASVPDRGIVVYNQGDGAGVSVVAGMDNGQAKFTLSRFDSVDSDFKTWSMRAMGSADGWALRRQLDDTSDVDQMRVTFDEATKNSEITFRAETLKFLGDDKTKSGAADKLVVQIKKDEIAGQEVTNIILPERKLDDPCNEERAIASREGATRQLLICSGSPLKWQIQVGGNSQVFPPRQIASDPTPPCDASTVGSLYFDFIYGSGEKLRVCLHHGGTNYMWSRTDTGGL